MTIENEIAKTVDHEKDESFISDYSLKSDRIVFYNKGDDVEESFKYRDLMMDDYETDDDIVKNTLDKVKSSLDEVWDDDIESFELERVTDTNEKGEVFVKQLQFNIPTENEHQPVTVLKVHNENEDFIAHNVKSRLQNDENKSINDMKKFKTGQLYIDDPDDPESIHEKETDYIKSVKHYIKEKNHLHKSVAKELPELDEEPSPLDYSVLSIHWILFFGICGFVTIPICMVLSVAAIVAGEYEPLVLLIGFMFMPIIVLYYIIYHLVKPFYSGFSFKKEIVELNS